MHVQVGRLFWVSYAQLQSDLNAVTFERESEVVSLPEYDRFSLIKE